MKFERIVLLTILVIISGRAFGQNSFLRTLKHFDSYSAEKKARLKRYYFGYGIPYMNVDVTTHYTSLADYGTTPATSAIDMTKKTHLTITNGFGGVAGTFYPLAYTSKQSALCLEVGLSEFFYNYNFGPVNFGSATFTDQSVVGIAGVPIGIAYKSGGEVTLNKRDKSTLSIAIGIEPTMCISKFMAPDLQFGARRFIAFEVGAFAGIEWKLRMSYYSGKFLLVDKVQDPLNNVSDYKVLGGLGTMDVKAIAGGDFKISLTLLPFSFKWDKAYRGYY